jgi:Uma2 family endonuclease
MQPVITPEKDAATLSSQSSQKIYVARGISFEEFLKQFDGVHAEWHNGNVELVMANNLTHQNIVLFLATLLQFYLSIVNIGKVMIASFTMKTLDHLPAREPDILIVLNEHRERIRHTFLDGAADIAIEIVSPESIQRDYDDKFKEYQEAGVREYWLFDPQRRIADIHWLNEQGQYERLPLNPDGYLISKLLPNFALDPDILWREELPVGMELMQLVQKMTAQK